MDSDAEPFVLVIPPPNVTGALHIGHALTNAIQDTVIRYQRMKGRNALWVPGTDHAGIATQTVVEKKVAREQGKTRHDLGREAFLDEVHKYVAEYGNRIGGQQRAMGISVDWDREAFTLDANLTRAVLEAFVRLHKVPALMRTLKDHSCTASSSVCNLWACLRLCARYRLFGCIFWYPR
jgi:valyl-tRNA synthetase